MNAQKTNGNSPLLWTLWLWRLALALASGWAVSLLLEHRSAEQVFDQLLYFTTLSTIAVFLFNLSEVVRPFVIRTGGRNRFESRSPWLRGMATSMAIFTGVVFATLLEGAYPDTVDKLAHLVCPIAMAVDWAAVGRSQGRLHVLSPATWSALLLPYIFFVYPWDARRDGKPMYEFLDPSKDDWPVTVGAVIAAFVILSYLLWAIARLRAKALSPR